MKRKAPFTLWIVFILFAGLAIYEINGAVIGFQRYEYYSSLPLTFPFPALLAGNVAWGVGSVIIALGLLLRRKWCITAAPIFIIVYALGEYIPLVLLSEEQYTVNQFIVRAISWLLLIGIVILLFRGRRLRHHLDAVRDKGTLTSRDSDHSVDSGNDTPHGHAG